MDLFAAVAQERRDFADLVAGLNQQQLRTPSLCGSWTVRDVAGHLCVLISASLPTLAGAMLRARGNFDRANDALSRSYGARPVDDFVTILRRHAGSRATPPRHDATAPLTDLLVHGQDVRRPLGIERELPAESLRACLDFLAGPRASLGFVPRHRLDGLALRATDLDWGSGAGEPVEGPGEALLMAMTGRPVGLGGFTGGGVELLAARLR